MARPRPRAAAKPKTKAAAKPAAKPASRATAPARTPAKPAGRPAAQTSTRGAGKAAQRPTGRPKANPSARAASGAHGPAAKPARGKPKAKAAKAKPKPSAGGMAGENRPSASEVGESTFQQEVDLLRGQVGTLDIVGLWTSANPPKLTGIWGLLLQRLDAGVSLRNAIHQIDVAAAATRDNTAHILGLVRSHKTPVFTVTKGH